MTALSSARIQFSERMSGWLAMGATDPRLGERDGRAAKSRFTFDATVCVDDVHAFAHTSDHAATLTGSVTFAPLAVVSARPGQVRLFAPNPADAGKVLAYDLPFTHEGHDYFLAGRKFVRGGAPWRMWPETTTLHTRLHLGADVQGPVVAAGVLHISAFGLLHTLTTFRGAGVAGYGRFFAAELWDSYGVHFARPSAAS